MQVFFLKISKTVCLQFTFKYYKVAFWIIIVIIIIYLILTCPGLYKLWKVHVFVICILKGRSLNQRPEPSRLNAISVLLILAYGVIRKKYSGVTLLW